MDSDRENIQASVLDRLLDNDPKVSRETVQHRLVDVGRIKSALVRDLENLLDTRRSIIDPPAGCR